MSDIDFALLGAFIAFGVVSWRSRISYRVSVTLGLVLLAVATALAIGDMGGAADFVAALAYYSLLVGVALAVVEYRRNEKTSRKPKVVTDSSRLTGRVGRARGVSSVRGCLKALSKWIRHR